LITGESLSILLANCGDGSLNTIQITKQKM